MQFKLSEIINAPHRATIYADRESQFSYNVWIHSSLKILSDECTLVGVLNRHKKQLVCCENLHDPRSRLIFQANSDYVTSVYVNELKDLLLTIQGNQGSGRLVEYVLSTAQVLRDYGPILNNELYVCAIFDEFYIFGGYKNTLGFVDKCTKRVHLDKIVTSIGYIYSMTVCRLSGNPQKVLLIVVGYYQDYSRGKTDVFDITDLIHSQQSITQSLNKFKLTY